MTTPLATDEIVRKVIAIVVDSLRVDPAAVTARANLMVDLGAESIDIVDIRFRIEETFGFKVGQEELAQILSEGSDTADVRAGLTVERIVEYIARRLREKAST